jgi:Lipocalin-like domain
MTKISLALLALIALAAPANAGLKEQLVGTWMVESNTEAWDNGDKKTWGPDFKGMLMFDAAGHYSFQMGVGGRPKSKGNPADEPKGKYVGYFGAYEVDEASNTFTLKVERCTSPNLEGSAQKRIVTAIDGAHMTYKAAQPIMAGEHKIVPTLELKKLN